MDLAESTLNTLRDVEINKCFEKLKWHLGNVLLMSEDGPRQAEDHEFMLMSHEKDVLAFKHTVTRNYVYIYPMNLFYVPVTEVPFHKGVF